MHLKRRRVLLAEEDGRLRAAISAELTLAGFDVVSAADSVHALAALETDGVDLALIDAQNSNGGAFDLCAQMRSQPKLRNVPVVFLSGSAEGIVQRFTERLSDAVGGNYCLPIPRQIRKLSAMVRRAMDMSASE